MDSSMGVRSLAHRHLAARIDLWWVLEHSEGIALLPRVIRAVRRRSVVVRVLDP
jgi:hypothetical protein